MLACNMRDDILAISIGLEVRLLGFLACMLRRRRVLAYDRVIHPRARETCYGIECQLVTPRGSVPRSFPITDDTFALVVKYERSKILVPGVTLIIKFYFVESFSTRDVLKI